jgi:hypothetical protein
MKSFASCLIGLLMCLPALALPAFKGAVGFGSDTVAGRGGKIIRVTTLDASGEGSLRTALEASGPRIVIFEVGGVIDLAKHSIIIDDPYLTVAGQTAPEPGITLIKGGLSIQTHDVVIRHIRIRPGDAGEAKRSGFEPDGITTSGENAYNIVIDHCSITWAVDENLSASGARTKGPEFTSRNITFSNNIIAEALNDSSHAKGPHSKGTLIHDNCRNISIIGNLYAHNDQRNPYFKAFTTGAVVNNVIYNAKFSAIKINFVKSEWEGTGIIPQKGRLSVVNNLLIHGSDTRKKLSFVAGYGDVYLEGNDISSHLDPLSQLANRGITRLTEKPVWPEKLHPIPTTELPGHIQKCAGARPALRDAIDTRIVDDFLNYQGRIIDSQEEVGGYPDLPPSYRKLTVPEDIDAWLEKYADEAQGE